MKYMGSKARLVKDLAPIINNIIVDKQITTYIEPFVGGANMIEHIKCDPPYEGRTGYKSNIDYKEYWNWVREMSSENIVLCSEYNAPEDFINIYEKTLITTLDKNSRKKDIERLFIHESRFSDVSHIIKKL